MTLLELCSCAASHFVDPILTPVFNAPMQGEIQGNIDLHDKISVQGAYSLPMDFIADASREWWGHGLSNDQEVTTIATGHFWPIDNSSILILAGVGFGAHRLSNAQGTTGLNDAQKLLYSGDNDFREYFLQILFSHTLSITPLKCDVGVASRFNYLDQYNFYQSELEWTINPNNNASSDTSISIYSNPRQTSQFDFAGFLTVGVEHIQLYLQLLLQLPLEVYSYDPSDIFIASCGICFSF